MYFPEYERAPVTAIFTFFRSGWWRRRPGIKAKAGSAVEGPPPRAQATRRGIWRSRLSRRRLSEFWLQNSNSPAQAAGPVCLQ